MSNTKVYFVLSFAKKTEIDVSFINKKKETVNAVIKKEGNIPNSNKIFCIIYADFQESFLKNSKINLKIKGNEKEASIEVRIDKKKKEILLFDLTFDDDFSENFLQNTNLYESFSIFYSYLKKNDEKFLPILYNEFSSRITSIQYLESDLYLKYFSEIAKKKEYYQNFVDLMISFNFDLFTANKNVIDKAEDFKGVLSFGALEKIIKDYHSKLKEKKKKNAFLGNYFLLYFYFITQKNQEKGEQIPDDLSLLIRESKDYFIFALKALNNSSIDYKFSKEGKNKILDTLKETKTKLDKETVKNFLQLLPIEEQIVSIFQKPEEIGNVFSSSSYEIDIEKVIILKEPTEDEIEKLFNNIDSYFSPRADEKRKKNIFKIKFPSDLIISILNATNKISLVMSISSKMRNISEKILKEKTREKIESTVLESLKRIISSLLTDITTNTQSKLQDLKVLKMEESEIINDLIKDNDILNKITSGFEEIPVQSFISFSQIFKEISLLRFIPINDLVNLIKHLFQKNQSKALEFDKRTKSVVAERIKQITDIFSSDYICKLRPKPEEAKEIFDCIFNEFMNIFNRRKEEVIEIIKNEKLTMNSLLKYFINLETEPTLKSEFTKKTNRNNLAKVDGTFLMYWRISIVNETTSLNLEGVERLLKLSVMRFIKKTGDPKNAVKKIILDIEDEFKTEIPMELSLDLLKHKFVPIQKLNPLKTTTISDDENFIYFLIQRKKYFTKENIDLTSIKKVKSTEDNCYQELIHEFGKEMQKIKENIINEKVIVKEMQNLIDLMDEWTDISSYKESKTGEESTFNKKISIISLSCAEKDQKEILTALEDAKKKIMEISDSANNFKIIINNSAFKKYNTDALNNFYQEFQDSFQEASIESLSRNNEILRKIEVIKKFDDPTVKEFVKRSQSGIQEKILINNLNKNFKEEEKPLETDDVLKVIQGVVSNLEEMGKKVFLNTSSLTISFINEYFNNTNIDKELDFLPTKAIHEKFESLASIRSHFKLIISYREKRTFLANLIKVLKEFWHIECNDFDNFFFGDLFLDLDSELINLNSTFEKYDKTPYIRDEDNKAYKCLKIICDSSHAVGLLYSIQIEKLKSLPLFFNPNTGITIENITQTIKLRKIFEEFKECKSIDSLVEKINNLEESEVTSLNTLYLIERSIDAYRELFSSIQSGEKNQSKLFEIMTDSYINFVVKETDEIEYDSSIKNYYKVESNKFNSEFEFKELCESSLLISRKNLGKAIKDNGSSYEKLSKNYEVIKQLNEEQNLLNMCYDKGCLINSTIQNIIQDSNVTVKQDESNSRKLEDFIKILKEKIESFENTTISYYSQFFEVTFLFGKQFLTFYKFIQGPENQSLPQDLESLFLFITNGKKIKTINKAIKAAKKKLNGNCSPEEGLMKGVKEFINVALEDNKLDFKTIFAKNTLKDGVKRGFYYKPYTDSIQVEILRACFEMSSSYPIASTIFICKEDTKKEEIIAFLYRVLKCDYNVLFLVVNFHLLKNHIIKEGFDIFKGNESIPSALIFLLPENQEDDAVRDIKTVITTSNFYIDYSFSSGEDETFEEIRKMATVYSSNSSGTGKSYAIEQKIKDENVSNHYIFPIGTESTIDGIIKRLKEIFNESNDDHNGKTVLHISLYDSQKELRRINEYLFYIIFTKFLITTERYFFIPKDVEIIIEVPFGFYNYKAKFPILELFQEEPQNISTETLLKFDKNNKDLVNKLNTISTYLTWIENKEINKKILEEEDIEEYSEEKLLKIFKKDDNYYKMLSQINILANFFSSFKKNIYLNPDALKSKLSKRGFEIRSAILEQFIDVSEICSKSTYKNITDSKYFSKMPEEKEESEKELALDFYVESSKITYENLPGGFCLINRDGQSISIITNSHLDDGLKKKLTNLWNSQSEKSDKKLVDYSKMDKDGFKKEIKKYFNLVGKKEVLLQKIPNNYYFTEDNYFKMILIDIKISSDIPVLLMGETGCGKTFLIKTLSCLYPNVCLKILNVHSGVTEEKVISFMNEVEELAKKNENVWVFFDEINTSFAVGLMSEIICDNRMRGKKLSKNIKYISACNPFRRKKEKERKYNGLVKKRVFKDLVYHVLPLPHSLLNFVFDFGSLEEKDEKKYIEAMVDKISFEDGLVNEKEIISSENKKIATDLIVLCHSYFRRNKDVSSVSLRDARRFSIFYKWFLGEIKNETKKKVAQPKAIILSIYLCYVLRISEKKDLYEEINNYVKINCPDISKEPSIEEMIKKEQDKIMEKVKLPLGIAMNTALRENLFSLYACVSNRVPIFICGKPGCSKTLSVSLLNNLLSLKIVYYQGSYNSTSEDIIKTFEKAKELNKRKESNDEDYTVTVFFDEMGLAEISNNNPLKVLHSYLEYDDNDNKVAFIGISNWDLDASKQNRGVFISRPDPTEEDLQETAKVISQSYRINSNDQLFQTLARCYFKYKDQFKESEVKEDKEINFLEDFHGTRDFYSLIKQISFSIKNDQIKYSDNKNLLDLVKKCLERNFRGIDFTKSHFNTIGSLFLRENNKSENFVYQIKELIEENIEDVNSRYLLLISKTSISYYLLEFLLRKKNKLHYFYIGSQFKKDIDSPEYANSVLNQLLLHVEEDNFLIMKNLESIYPSLYDLFNQNFNYVGEDRKYAKVAIGMVNNPEVFVNPKFRCGVLLDEDDIKNQDPPFLNRFEKHIISFKILLKESEENLAKNIYKNLQEMTSLDKEKYKDLDPMIVIDNQRLNYNEEEIMGMIYKSRIEERNDYEIEQTKVTKDIMKKIIKTFSQDFIMFALYSKFNISKNQGVIKELFDTEYNYIPNLSYLLSTTMERKNIVYTFTKIFDSIKLDENSESKLTKLPLKQNNFFEIDVSKVQSQVEVEKSINEFYENLYKKNSFVFILIVKFGVEQTKHLNLVAQLINNIKRNLSGDEKDLIVFTIHMRRLFTNQSTEIKQRATIEEKNYISYLSEFNQVFIDDLNSDINHSIFHLMKSDGFIGKGKFFDVSSCFDKILKDSYSSLDLKILNDKTYQDNRYVNEKIEAILKEKKIREYFIQSITNHLNQQKEIFYNFFKKNLIVEKDIDILSKFQLYLVDLSKRFLTRFIISLESRGAMDFLLSNPGLYKQKIDALYKEFPLKDKPVNSDKISNPVKKFMDLKIFLSVFFLKKVYKIISPFISSYQINEQNFFETFEAKNGSEVEMEVEDKSQENEYDKRREIIESKYEIKVNSLISSYGCFAQFNDIKKEDNIEEGNLKEDFILFYTVKKGKNFEFKLFFEKIFDENLLYSLFDEKKKKPFELLTSSIIWLEAYEDFIEYFYRRILDIAKFQKDTISKILSEILKETSTAKNDDKRKLNSKQLLVILNEKLLQYLISLLDSNLQNLPSYFDLVSSSIESAKNIQENYKITSALLYNLEVLYELFKIIPKEENYQEKIQEFKKNLQREATIDLSNSEELKNIIEKEYDMLNQYFSGKNDYSFLVNFLIIKYKSINNENVQRELIQIILNREELFLQSFSFLKIILENKKISPEDDTIFNQSDPILNQLEENKNIQFHFVIMDSFRAQIEKYLIKYFVWNPSININVDSKEKEALKDFLSGEPFQIFKKYAENYTKENKKIYLLFQITYIKVYLFYASVFFMNEKLYNSFQESTLKLTSTIKSENEDYLKYYFLKCIKYRYNDSFFSFSDFPWTTFKMDGFKVLDRDDENEEFKYSPVKVYYVRDLGKYRKFYNCIREFENGKFANKGEINKKFQEDELLLIEVFCQYFLIKFLDFRYKKKNFDYFNTFSSIQDKDSIISSISQTKKKTLGVIFTKFLEEKVSENEKEDRKTDTQFTLTLFSIQFFLVLSEEATAFFKDRKIYKREKDLLELTLDILTLFVNLGYLIADENFNFEKYKKNLFEQEEVLHKIGIEILNSLEDPFFYISEIYYNSSKIEGDVKEELKAIINDKILKESSGKKEEYINNYYEFSGQRKESLRCMLDEVENPCTNKAQLMGYFVFTQYLTPYELKKIINNYPETIICKYFKESNTLKRTTSVVKFLNPLVNKVYKLFNKKISWIKASKKEFPADDRNKEDLGELIEKANASSCLDDDLGIKKRSCLTNFIVNSKHDNGKNLYNFYEGIIANYNKSIQCIENSVRKSSKKDIKLFQGEGVIVQEASVVYDLVESPDDINTKIFEIIDKNSRRFFTQSNFKIYKDVHIFIDKIDDEIITKLLKGKKKLSTKEQREFTYLYESSDSDSKDLFEEFLSNHNQTGISKLDKKKETLIKEALSGKKITPELFNELLLYLIYEQKGKSKDITINQAINELPYHFSSLLTNEFKECLRADFKTKDLISIYEYIEEGWFDVLAENVSQLYQVKLEQTETQKIEKTISELKILKVDVLLPIIRKLILRKLIRYQEKNDNLDENIFNVIKSNNLWEKNLTKDPKKQAQFEEELKKLNDLNILTKKSVEFYKQLRQIKEKKSNNSNNSRKKSVRRV